MSKSPKLLLLNVSAITSASKLLPFTLVTVKHTPLVQILSPTLVFSNTLFALIINFEDLTPLLKDKITVFMGQTGVGKTTLLNTLAPDLALETNEISDSLGRGRHTTRAVTLYNIYGGKIADTPGFSSLDYEITSSEELNAAFPELLKLSAACKFRSCTHTHEPGCAVKLALAQRKIWEKRYQTYLQILSEIENRRETYKKVLKRK